ncbi:MAG: DUF2442 domain-containing protein [Holophagales bacterium]|jgi:hypothetical protein|nr:DUF2442 domain-containing protein [Holophagales bacterium]
MSIIDTIPLSEEQGAEDGITIRMYFLDHEPPHIHAIKGEAESILSLDGEEIDMTCPAADKVVPMPDNTLFVTFENGVTKLYDAKPLADSGCKYEGAEIFRELLNDDALFMAAKLSPCGCAVIWDDGTDLAIEEIWENGKTVYIEKITVKIACL